MAEILNMQSGDTENTPSPPGHDEAMIKKFDDSQAPATTGKPEKPADVPDKFWNAETGEVDYASMVKSYNELSKKLGSDTPKAEDEAEDKGLKIDPATATTEEVKAEMAKAGVDYAALETEYAANGGLTDDTYAKLAAAGHDRARVDQYIAGQVALAEKIQAEVYAVAGGSPETFRAMAAWASENLPGDEIDAFNSVLDTRNVAQWKLATAGLYAKYTASVGNPGKLLQGETAVTSDAGDKYESMRQYVEDVKNPSYQNDHAFRAKVLAKLARSPANLR